MALQPSPDKSAPRITSLRNVSLFMELCDRLMNRSGGLPGFGVFYGFSGYGKTRAAIYAANKTQAYYVECGDSWNRSTLADALLHELTGSTTKATVAAKVAQIIRTLSQDTRPLIIDEADHLVKKSTIDIVREIADKSGAPVILIGEEQLPVKLSAFERAHNRVLQWQPAEPCDLEDARKLARLFSPDVAIDDALLAHLVDVTEGCTRRVHVNIDRIGEFALTRGLQAVSLKEWGPEQSYSGQHRPRPAKRRAPALARAS